MPLHNQGIKAGTTLFGVLCVSFENASVPCDSAPRIYQLARALSSYDNPTRLKEHAHAVVEMLMSQPHTLQSQKDPSMHADGEAVYLHDEDIDTDCEEDDDDPPFLATNPLWMTFKDTSMEKAYLSWAAKHMQALDPVGAISCSLMYLFIGISPSVAAIRSHLGTYLVGWISLMPALLSLLGPAGNWYRKRREACLLFFHFASTAWQCWTYNGTMLVGPDFSIFKSKIGSGFFWQLINLLMFQASFISKESNKKP